MQWFANPQTHVLFTIDKRKHFKCLNWWNANLKKRKSSVWIWCKHKKWNRATKCWKSNWYLKETAGERFCRSVTLHQVLLPKKNMIHIVEGLRKSGEISTWKGYHYWISPSDGMTQLHGLRNTVCCTVHKFMLKLTKLKKPSVCEHDTETELLPWKLISNGLRQHRKFSCGPTDKIWNYFQKTSMVCPPD